MQGQKFGASNLHWHVALVDAIINAYNDLKHNAEYLGGATVFASGKDARYKRDSSGDPLPVGIAPNTMYMLGEGGDMQLLDTANLQKALLDTIEKLDKKLIRNAEITEVGAGVYSSQQELSGKALKILIQPLLDKITPMRAIRRRRYTMLFWMVQRLLQVYGSPEEKALFAGDLYNCYLEFGNILPDDEAEQVDEYVKLEGLIGIEATLDKMIENGWTLDKAAILAAKQEAAEKAQASMMDAFGVRRAQDTGGSDTGAGNADQGAGGQEQ